MTSKHKNGQYFTTHNDLKEKIFEFILNNPDIILEPSIGQGDLVMYISDRISSVEFDMYEIDTEITLLEGMNRGEVVYGDFMTQSILKKY